MGNRADPVTLLEQHLIDRGETQSDFARRSGVERSVVSRALARERRPGLDSASRIQEATGIPAAWWAHFRPRRKGRAKAAQRRAAK